MRPLVLLTGAVAIVAGLGVAVGHDPAPYVPPAPVFTWAEASPDVCRWLGHDYEIHGADACRYVPPVAHRGPDPCPGTLTYEAALAAGCFDGSAADNAVGQG
jgi:hypothetical protein